MFVPAIYSVSPLPLYRGNPVIEALPQIRPREETAAMLGRDVGFDPDHRQLPVEYRRHLVAQIPAFFEPLSVHLELDDRLGTMVRIGYVNRNPLDTAFQSQVESGIKAIRWLAPSVQHLPWVSTSGMTLLGISGIGKTTAIMSSLSLFPQVIAHSSYAGHDLPLLQIVWMKLDCPHDGSVRGLCINFFQEVDRLLGTDYERDYVKTRSTVDSLLPSMARVAAQHCLGMLVVDEIQHLSQKRSGGHKKMLNFFVQLVNTIGLPVVLVGTYRAREVLGGELRQARRGTGQGDLEWRPMQNDAEFHHFCSSLWEYQYVQHPVDLTNDLKNALYDETQGITDLVVKYFMQAQIRAMTTGHETITVDLIHSVADSFTLIRPILNAIRTRDYPMLDKLDDVIPRLPDGSLDWAGMSTGSFGDPSSDAGDRPNSKLVSRPKTSQQSPQPAKQAKTRNGRKGTRPNPKPLSVIDVEPGSSAYSQLLTGGFIRPVAPDLLRASSHGARS